MTDDRRDDSAVIGGRLVFVTMIAIAILYLTGVIGP